MFDARLLVPRLIEGPDRGFKDLRRGVLLPIITQTDLHCSQSGMPWKPTLGDAHKPSDPPRWNEFQGQFHTSTDSIAVDEGEYIDLRPWTGDQGNTSYFGSLQKGGLTCPDACEIDWCSRDRFADYLCDANKVLAEQVSRRKAGMA